MILALAFSKLACTVDISHCQLPVNDMRAQYVYVQTLFVVFNLHDPTKDTQVPIPPHHHLPWCIAPGSVDPVWLC